jgi:hypothetical protein
MSDRVIALARVSKASPMDAFLGKQVERSKVNFFIGIKIRQKGQDQRE